jgi:hypothetical protein
MDGGARRKLMTHTALLALMVAACAIAAPSFAYGAAPDSEDNRYTFNRADEGYLRLDGRTGHVSICTRRTVGWACQLVPDERAALETEIARLQGENASLKKELLGRNLPLPDAVKPDPSPLKPEEPRLQLPSDADLNKVMTFIEKVWRRLVEMIVNLQKDVLRKS